MCLGMIPKSKPAPFWRAPVGMPWRGARLRGGAENRHSAAVLRPARNVVADRDRAFLAVGDRAHTAGLDSARREIVAHGLGAASAQGDVVFARAALVGMPFDREGVVAVLLQPLRLLVERAARRPREFGGIGSKNTRSPTLTTKSCWLPGAATPAEARESLPCLLAQADSASPAISAATTPAATKFTQHTGHAGASILEHFAGPTAPDLAGGSLSERSINLDEALSRPGKMHRPPEPYLMVNGT